MANGKQAKTRRLKMSERAQQQMQLLFPGMPEAWVWRRSTNDGYSTVPRTLPIVMQGVDDQSKGQPAGHVLFCLWARSPDHPLVTIENPSTFAAEAGFMGELALDTWRRRMRRLRELNLIATKEGASGEFHYVLLLNPNAALRWMKESGLVQDVLYARFMDRLIDVGAHAEIAAVEELFKQQREEAAKAKEAQEAEAAKAKDAQGVAPKPKRAKPKSKQS